MKWLGIILTVLSMLGCGSSGGDGARSTIRLTNGLGAQAQDPVLFVQLPIAQKQTSGSGSFVLSRFVLQNNDTHDHHIDSFLGQFEASIPGLVMNYELLIDGKPVHRATGLT